MKEQLMDLLHRHSPHDSLEQKHVTDTLRFLTQTDNCTSTTNLSGHVTASAWVLNPDSSAVLLTHHKKLGRWFQLGGHIEDDDSIQAASLREAEEESGIGELRLVSQDLFDLDVHLIPARNTVPEHYHYDFRFLLVAGDTEFHVSEESNELAWVDFAQLKKSTDDPSIHRMLVKTGLQLHGR